MSDTETETGPTIKRIRVVKAKKSEAQMKSFYDKCVKAKLDKKEERKTKVKVVEAPQTGVTLDEIVSQQPAKPNINIVVKSVNKVSKVKFSEPEEIEHNPEDDIQIFRK